jgi:hypothetical protein
VTTKIADSLARPSIERATLQGGTTDAILDSFRRVSTKTEAFSRDRRNTEAILATVPSNAEVNECDAGEIMGSG